MLVIGIDFGNESSFIAVPRGGGIEVISNDFSLRPTPSCVAFSNRCRILGVAAKNQLITNLKNTIFGFKRLLGKMFDDPAVNHEIRYLPYQIIRRKDGTIGIKVHYLDEDHVFSIQQITAMFFTKLKETAEAALKCQVDQCVISVPSFFDNTERQALLDAASIAGLKVLRIFNETAATALTYGIYKQDLPTPEEAPRNVIFVDCGHTSLQVFACAFNKGKLKMLASAADPQLGGRDIDIILAEHFSVDFKQRYDIDPTKNSRAFLRLLGEVEKLKKQMSANSTKLPIHIECFMNDKDVTSDMKRVDMEALCGDLFKRVEKVLLRCLQESQLSKEDIHSVEIVGGTSRVPAIKALIENVFGKVPSTTLNVDEAVARGCALQCAMLCPAIFVRDFSITDIQNYPINLQWEPTSNQDGGEMEVFPRNHAIPFTKMVTFQRREPFRLQAYYAHNNRHIGQFAINDVKPDAAGQNQKVKVKARINLDGIFSVVNATLSEKLDLGEQEEEEAAAAEPMDVSPPPSDENQPEPEATSPEGEVEKSDGKPAEKKEKKKRAGFNLVELPVKVELVGQYNSSELNGLIESECKMVSADRQERDRIDARNTLEEYVYELRSKLSDELSSFIPEPERQKICKQLDEIEEWLYEEGEECQRQVYSQKLEHLRSCGEPIKKRKVEFELQPALFEEFSSVLQLTQKAIDQYKAGDDKYAHLEQSEMGKVQESTSCAWKWVEETRSKLQNASRYHSPAVSVEQILNEKSSFEQTVGKILSKPKPQPPPAQQSPAAESKEESKAKNESAGKNPSQLPNGDEAVNA